MNSPGPAQATALLDQLDGVIDSFDTLQRYLDDVVHVVAAEVPGCDAVGITLVADGKATTAAYTSAVTLDIDAMQYALDEGPCLEAHETKQVVRAELDEAYDRWPRFTDAAQEEKTRALIAYPLLAGGTSVGALNLYARSASALAEADDVVMLTAGAHVGRVVAAGLKVIEARELAGQLEQALVSRAVIEQAKGVLMGRHGFTEIEAFDLIKKQSQRTNIKLRLVARSIVDDATGSQLPSAGQAVD